jgi:peptidoglycan/LPS O-acetylase OafA/YrhL
MRLVPLALALMVLGSLGPWARDIFVTDYGIDRAGYVILAIALAAGLLLALHARRGRRSPLPLAAALLATAALVVLAADFRELVDDGLVSPAWGLYLAFAGSAALVALSMALLTGRR